MKRKAMAKKLLALFAMIMLTLMTVKPVLAADGTSIDTAITIKLGKTVSGTVPGTHYYKFTLPGSGTVTISGGSISGRLYWDLYDEYASNIKGDSNWGSFSATYELTKGTYYVRISSENSGTYKFGVRFKDAHESFSENYGGSDNTKFDANNISLNKSYNGHLGVNDSDDWYKFTVSASGKYKFSFLALNRKNVYLYNEANEQLKHSDNSDYTETWELTKGTYYLKMTADSYSYYSSYSFQISKPEAPKATSISKLQSLSKGFKINVKKVSATGYQVQYALNSKFTSAKTKTVSKNSTTSVTIAKLTAKKKYYVRIRTYKNANVNGTSTKLYSGWSKAKAVKIK